MLMEFLKEVPDHRDAEARQYDLASVLLCTILARGNCKIRKAADFMMP